MRKTLIIGLKDLSITLRDRAALIMMLIAPFALTLGLGFVSGRFSKDTNDAGLSHIPVIIVNQDAGPLGLALEQALRAEEVAALLTAKNASDPVAARQQVDERQSVAAIIVPAGFSDSIQAPDNSAAGGVSLELYVDPARPISSGIVRTIVESFLGEIEARRLSGSVAVRQLLTHGLLSPDEARAVAIEMSSLPIAEPIRLESTVSDMAAAAELDVLAFFAPGMAMLFLMYTVTQGGRSILAERREGTLARLLSTPTGAAQVLGGKVFGIFLTGVAQVGLLVAASSLLFGLRWGDPTAVVLLILAVAAAATGWGVLLAAVARTPAQAGSLGTALMLLFGMLGGTFISAAGFPSWLRTLSRLTPNSWGLDAFSQLGAGASLGDIGAPLLALVVMAAALFGVAVVVGRRGALAPR